MMNRFFKPAGHLVTLAPKLPRSNGFVNFLGVAITNAILQRTLELGDKKSMLQANTENQPTGLQSSARVA